VSSGMFAIVNLLYERHCKNVAIIAKQGFGFVSRDQ
jgi:hypothetical protein